MSSLIFDTCFLIDFQQERKRGAGPAHRFLRDHEEAYAHLSSIAYGEFAEGFASLSDPAFLSVVEAFQLLEITRPVADRYGRLARELRRSRQLIGSNDLWIAATAVQHELPLVTRNIDHFKRIPGLEIVPY
ncbi:MAG: type II toxin-antitoxin system VapC family toxin [Opitutales bacterium]